jgi:hypothetical protein
MARIVGARARCTTAQARPAMAPGMTIMTILLQTGRRRSNHMSTEVRLARERVEHRRRVAISNAWRRPGPVQWWTLSALS